MRPTGQRWRIDSKESLEFFCLAAKKRIEAGKPLVVEIRSELSSKTVAQVRYMHSLCAALADHVHCPLEEAKADCKALYGVVEVSSSHVDGSRRVRLKSFADYSRAEASTFCNQLQAYLDENLIPYTAAVMPDMQD